MSPAEIYKNLNDTFNDWDGLLANPRFCRRNGLISWNSFAGGRLKEPVASEQLLAVVEARQFSFQCAEDGSIFQLLYRFNEDDVLETARLAFYLLKTRGNFEQGASEVVSSAWIRIDYDLAAASGLLHNDCHLHLHGFPYARMIVDGVPGPRQFVELVISLCYPDFYRIHRLNDQGGLRAHEVLAKVNACQLSKEEPLNLPPPLLHVSLPRGNQTELDTRHRI